MRLELTIIAAALLVLVLCRQPPKSGNAGIVSDTGLTPPANQISEGREVLNPTPAGEPSLDGMTSDNTTAGLTIPPQPKTMRVGVVDARQCNGLNYKDVLYGNVTVKWVWDGQKLVPRKVCEVKEDDGTTSIWSFEERDGISTSEIQPGAQP